MTAKTKGSSSGSPSSSGSSGSSGSTGSLNPNYSYSTNYDPNADYQKMINDSVANNDYAAAAAYEQARNLKIASEGLPYEKTNNYQSYAGKGVNDAIGSSSSAYGGMSTGGMGEYTPNPYLDDYKAQQEALIRAQTQAGVDRLKSQIPGINESYDKMAQEAYIQNMISKRDLPQQLSASGLTGGVSESSNIALQTQYGNALNQGEIARRNAVLGVENSIVDLKNTGDMSLAQSGTEYAKMAMEDYYRALEQQNYLNSFKYQQDMTEREWNRTLGLDEYGKSETERNWDWMNKEFDYNAEQDAYERALKEQQLKQQLAKGSSGGGSGGYSSGYSSGGGSTLAFDSLSDAAKKYANLLQNWESNQKDYKYTDEDIANAIAQGASGKNAQYGEEVARELAKYFGFDFKYE